jgi:hypothetical protein
LSILIKEEPRTGVKSFWFREKIRLANEAVAVVAYRLKSHGQIFRVYADGENKWNPIR